MGCGYFKTTANIYGLALKNQLRRGDRKRRGAWGLPGGGGEQYCSDGGVGGGPRITRPPSYAFLLGLGHLETDPGRGVNKQHSIFMYGEVDASAISMSLFMLLHRHQGEFPGRGDHYLLCPRSMPASDHFNLVNLSARRFTPLFPQDQGRRPPCFSCVLDLALHCQEKESYRSKKDGPVVSVHSVGGVTGYFVRHGAVPKDGHIKYRKEGHKKGRAHALYPVCVPELKFCTLGDQMA